MPMNGLFLVLIKAITVNSLVCTVQLIFGQLFKNLIQRWNLKNLSRGLNPPKTAKTRFKFSAGLNLETLDTILSGTNHI